MLAFSSLLLGFSVAFASGALSWLILKGAQVARAFDSSPVSQAANSALGMVLPYIRLIAAYLKNAENASLGRDVKARLSTVGNPSQLTPSEFIALCVLSGASSLGSALILALVLRVTLGVPLILSLPIALLVGVIAAVLPLQQLHSAASTRVRDVNRSLPYVMDLLLLMLEAGANILEAIETVAQENSYGALGEELALVSREMQHGEPLSAALESMAERIPSEDLGVIVRAINQGLVLGTPLTSALREQSDLLRLKRTQNAEKLGKEAGSRMAFPIIMIMMATFLLVLGPAALKFNKLFALR